MARAVIWADSAIAALISAAEYIASDSPSYAAALVAGASKTAQSLGTLSSRGRLVPEYRNPNIREVFVGSYRLIYHVSHDRIEIVVFIHGARDFSASTGE